MLIVPVAERSETLAFSWKVGVLHGWYDDSKRNLTLFGARNTSNAIKMHSILWACAWADMWSGISPPFVICVLAVLTKPCVRVWKMALCKTQEVKGFQIGHHASNKDCLLLYFCYIEQPRGNSSVGAAVLYIIQQLPYFQFVRRQTSDSGQVSSESQVISLRGS